ncbi:MAG TPA: FtsX-like permease family protein, partial [Candidatus Polarisedimenticolia bacterium]|nr:FtsX-like permease family protein [Candidatus Polarisedimenticolia bacterium]
QMALATTLLVGAALLTRSLVRLQGVPPGFADPNSLLTAHLTREAGSQADYERNLAFYQTLLEEVRALPGITDTALTSEVPFGDVTTQMPVVPAGRSLDVPGEAVQAQWRIASTDYFKTLGVALRRGRTFDPMNEPYSNLIISEGLARRLWPGGEDPVGRQVQLGNRNFFTIVGVVGDLRQLDLAREPTPSMYMATSWGILPTMTLVVRATGDPSALLQPIRQVVTRLDPHQPVSDFQTMRAVVAGNIAAPRMNTVLLASFAGLALILAVVGIAGVVGYSVGQRRHELAVRLTLGAPPGRVVRQVMRGGLLTCAAGIVAGLIAALALGRTLSSILYEVAATDPATLCAAAATLFVAAAVACWLPARRVARISPALTLREG